jgi:hypothetical protein
MNNGFQWLPDQKLLGSKSSENFAEKLLKN